jgi:uncharacterized protein YbjT (DUF2867 family)
MKITITGSLGNISKPLTKELVQRGHRVTVISSKPERIKEIEAMGVNAAIGSVQDIKFLTSAFSGADAVYTMVPPNEFFDHSLDLMTYRCSIGDNFVRAIQQAGVKRVVHLSSIGAHLEKDSGLILGHHAVEKIMNSIPDVAITIMRPASFYTNLYAFVGAIKSTGNIASNYGAGDKIVWVSPYDIASSIAEEIVTPLVGRRVLYVASEELSCNEVAGILGAAIGKPDLKWVIISDAQMKSGLEAFGMSKQIAAAMVEMNAGMHSGILFNDYYLHKPVLGKVKLKDFAKEFAAAFNKKG